MSWVHGESCFDCLWLIGVEKFDLADAAKVEQHRRVRHDDHEGNRALSEARSSSNICAVTVGMPRSPKARWKAKKSTPASSVAPTRPITPRAYREQASSSLISCGVRRKFSMVSGSVSVTEATLVEAFGAGQTVAWGLREVLARGGGWAEKPWSFCARDRDGNGRSRRAMERSLSHAATPARRRCRNPLPVPPLSSAISWLVLSSS